MKYLPLIITCLLAVPALAETGASSSADLMPAKKEISVPSNAPTIYLSMDKSELVHLDKGAASVIVGNPLHASVLMDTPQLLVIVPREPGATYFTVLDQNGNVILQRHVIVGAPQENYIRVRTSFCGEDAKECVKTQSYYCETEGMCHEIAVMKEDNNSNDSAPKTDNAENKDVDSFASETSSSNTEEAP